MEIQFQHILDFLEPVWVLLNKPIFNLNNSQISLTNILMSILVIVLTMVFAKYFGAYINSALKAKSVDSDLPSKI